MRLVLSCTRVHRFQQTDEGSFRISSDQLHPLGDKLTLDYQRRW
jgi:hypothetical protein